MISIATRTRKIYRGDSLGELQSLFENHQRHEGRLGSKRRMHRNHWPLWQAAAQTPTGAADELFGQDRRAQPTETAAFPPPPSPTRVYSCHCGTSDRTRTSSSKMVAPPPAVPWTPAEGQSRRELGGKKWRGRARSGGGYAAHQTPFSVSLSSPPPQHDDCLIAG